MTTCSITVADHVCGSTDGVRLYLTGHACRVHTPARAAGRAEPHLPPILVAPAVPVIALPPVQEQLALVEPGVCECGLGRADHWGNGRGNNRGTCRGWKPIDQKPIRIVLECPGCHLDPRAHAPHCPMGARARFAMAADGFIVGTAERGPEQVAA